MVTSSVIVFTGLVLAVAWQRLWELRKSGRNEAHVRALGGREHAAWQMPWMRLCHGAWLVSMLVEVLVFERPFFLPMIVAAAVVFVAGQALRLAAMHALGDRWTVRVMTLPGQPPVSTGVFRYLRHPNYLGVILEIAALPMIHGAWMTAIFFTIANAILLRARIAAEETALRDDNGYDAAFGDLPRFVPRSVKSMT